MPAPDWNAVLGGAGAASSSNVPPPSPPPVQRTDPTQTIEPAPTAQGRDQLARIASAMRMIESGDRQTDAGGKVIVSPKGAIGASQLMPNTAKALGVDPYDEGQNRAGGEKLLGQLYDKYGDWDKALIAYNWREDNTDKWIAAGADPAKLPNETREYAPDVLAQAGFSSNIPYVANAKRRVDWNEVLGDASSTPKPPGQSNDNDVSIGDIQSGLDENSSKLFGEQAEALVQGAQKGITDLFVGPTQTVLQQVSPEEAGKFTQWWNSQQESWGGAEVRRKHPVFSTIGEVAGMTAAIYGTKGMLTPLIGMSAGVTAAAEAASAVTQMVPRVLRAAGAAGALSATAYRPTDEGIPRWLSGVIGAGIGASGEKIANAISSSIKRFADRNTLNNVLQSLQATVGEMSHNATRPLQTVVSRAQQLNEAELALYAKVGGRTGFEPGPFTDMLREPAASSQAKGIYAHPTTAQYARRVHEELGLKKQAAEQAQSEIEHARHERAMAEWERTYATGIPENVKAATLQSDIASGRIPPPPTAPLPYIPRAISPVEYKAGLTALSRGISRTREAAAKTQLKMLHRDMTNEAARQASAVGQDLPKFLHALDAANTFHRENIVPFREIFGTSNVNDLTQKFTRSTMIDAFEKVLKSGDIDRAAKFKAVVGAGGIDDLRRIAQWHMFTDGQPTGGNFVPQLQTKFIRDNREVLQELFGRDGVQTMLGWGKIAERIETEAKEAAKKGHHYNRLVGGMAMVLAAERLGEGVMHGDAMRGIGEAGFILAASYFGHAVARFASQAERIPGILPLVKKAASLPADSPALATRIQRIETLYRRAGLVAARGTATLQVGQTPLSYQWPSQPTQ